MKLTQEVIEQFQKDFANAKTYNDLMGKDGVIKNLLKHALETMLEAELSEHLGYAKHSPEGDNSGNSRNGKSVKTIKNEQGKIEIQVPRDRNGSFDPIVVKKYQKTIGPIEEKIIAMYAKGMTVRDIQTYIQEIYGLEISAALISSITDRIVEVAKEWQTRPLSEAWIFVYFDAIHFKVREEGRVVTKAAYTALGVDFEGNREILGIRVGQHESATYWLSVFTELKARGVEDIFIASVDGLKGMEEAISAVYPECRVQRCVIHQIRNSMKFIPDKHRREFTADLKNIYRAVNEESALRALSELENKWEAKYPLATKSWRANWEGLSVMFEFPTEIRRVIYTTNSVEALHRQFRKVTKSKSIFPHDDALLKMLYLAYKDFHKKWASVRNWRVMVTQLTIIYGERFEKYLR
ncbi:MAG: IS256 family transposase ISDku1 [Ignavibacteriaceae bacterium]|nr:IS256 family transposase ISDku1 [Ignavibacteriaceae bacterium]MBV6445382.1 IS256 family transposase ISDku1 [Ignavibacteriaceae bacterium]